MVHRDLVVQDRGISTPYMKLLAPFSKFRERSYPASQIGILPRIASDYHNCWMNFGRLEEVVRERVFDTRVLNSRDLIALLHRVVANIGTHSYSTEWIDNDSQQQLKSKIANTTDELTVLMNHYAAEMAEKHLGHVMYDVTRDKTIPDKGDMYTFLDLGCGMFGTTSANHMEKLHQLSEEGLVPRNYNDFVHAIVLDVDAHATYRTEQVLSNPRQYGYNFRPPKKITRINTNFVTLDRHPELRKYEGEIDSVVAGASLWHVVDLSPLFHFLFNYLLSYRGAAFIWDWNAKTFAAQHLRVTPERDSKGHPVFDAAGNPVVDERVAGKFIFEILPRGAQKKQHILVENPALLGDKFFEKLNNSRWRSVYEMRAEDIAPNHSNMYAWMGYWGYIDRNPSSGRIDKARLDGDDVLSFYRDMFNRLAYSRRGFSPIHDFVINTLAQNRSLGVAPLSDDKVRYNFAESYGPSLAEKIMGVGHPAVDIPFHDIMHTMLRIKGTQARRLYNVPDLNPTQQEVRHAMMITVACRDRYYFESAFPPLARSLPKGR
jgi:hypothetical protein